MQQTRGEPIHQARTIVQSCLAWEFLRAGLFAQPGATQARPSFEEYRNRFGVREPAAPGRPRVTGDRQNTKNPWLVEIIAGVVLALYSLGLAYLMGALWFRVA
jgi:hypothetical protein